MLVSDSAPLIFFARYDGCDLLGRLWNQIVISPAVYREAVLDKPEAAGAAEIRSAIRWGTIKVLELQNNELADKLRISLGRGEAEAIALARQLDGSYLLIEDAKGYSIAKSHGVECIRVLRVLQIAKDHGFIPAIRPVAEALVRLGNYWSESVLRSFYSQAGE